MLSRYQLAYQLRHLATFQTIAEEQSFRRAAERLHIAQPALSRQIAQLEEALECSLFHREARRIRLTKAGEFLYRESVKTLQSLESIADQTRNVAQGRTALLRLGYSSAAMSSFLPSVIRSIRSGLEQADFSFVEKTSDHLIAAVIRGQLDAAFILHRPENPLLRMIPIRSEPVGIILPDNHPLAAHDSLSLESLRDETFILFPRQTNPVMYDEILAACREQGFSPTRVREVAPRSIAVGLVAAGAGIATIADSLQHSCVNGTCYRPLTEPGPRIRFSCITALETGGEWLDLLGDILQRDFASTANTSRQR